MVIFHSYVSLPEGIPWVFVQLPTSKNMKQIHFHLFHDFKRVSCSLGSLSSMTFSRKRFWQTFDLTVSGQTLVVFVKKHVNSEPQHAILQTTLQHNLALFKRWLLRLESMESAVSWLLFHKINLFDKFCKFFMGFMTCLNPNNPTYFPHIFSKVNWLMVPQQLPQIFVQRIPGTAWHFTSSSSFCRLEDPWKTNDLQIIVFPASNEVSLP